MPTAEEAEAHDRFEAANEALARRPKPPAPTCPACGEPPLTAQGMPDANAPPVQRWHCPQHVHLAQAGDMDPPPLPIDPFFRLIDPDEVAREQRQDELRAEQDRQRRELREHEAAERAAVKVARDASWKPQGMGWTA